MLIDLILQLVDSMTGRTPQVNPADVLMEATGLLVALVLGITVHEFGHAFAATWLGDRLPARQGRLTLAPAAHLEVMGSLFFLLAGFGWGKPVQYNPYALRAGPRSGPALVALAGPVSNVILAALFAIPVRLLDLVVGDISGPTQILFVLLRSIVYFNLVLAVFNLLPIPPLDGFSILRGVLPPDLAYQLERFQVYGTLILLALVFLLPGVLGQIVNPPLKFLLTLLIGSPH